MIISTSKKINRQLGNGAVCVCVGGGGGGNKYMPIQTGYEVDR